MARPSAVIHNPLLALPASRLFKDLPSEDREALRKLAREFRGQAQEKADAAWRNNKGIIAAYWKALSVYALHFERLCRPTPAAQEDA